EKLHTDGPLVLTKVEVLAGSLVASEDAFSRNEFGNENVCAVPFADLAENLVGYSSHRGEIERESAIKPRKGSVHVALSHKMLDSAGGSAAPRAILMNMRLGPPIKIELGGTRFRASWTCRSMSLHSLV